MIYLLLALFIGLRLINLRSTFLWLDDLGTIANKEPVPWNELPAYIAEYMQRITGPIIPTVLDSIIVNLFGPHVVALRLPSVMFAVGCFWLLARVLKLLFPADRRAYWVPLICFTFSVPSIIYAQQIQPTIYYFFATVAQLYVFIPFYRSLHDKRSDVYRRMVIFVLVVTVTFFMNYMVLLVTVLLSMAWSLRLYALARGRHIGLMQAGRYLLLLAAAHAGLVLITLNLPDANTTRNYLLDFYALDGREFLGRSYDLIVYHFKFAFEPDVYFPLSLNLFSLPFVVLVLLGAVTFVLRRSEHFLYAGITLMALYAASYVGIIRMAASATVLPWHRSCMFLWATESCSWGNGLPGSAWSV